MTSYQHFISRKNHSDRVAPVDPVYLPDCLFDFQQHVLQECFSNGRYAGFIDTGLGKTIIQLVLAENYVRTTNRRVLIMTPLAVAHQFITEAHKFDICDPAYSRDGKLSTDIVLCNYERLSKFNPEDFGTVICDESSILKNFDGKIKHQINQFIRRVDNRFLFTATPSPNDFVELGTSSEALGYLGYVDMLGRFFTNNENSIDPTAIGVKWVLKGHAVSDFFDWVSSWSISMRKPSDIGYSDDRHILPELVENRIFVAAENLYEIDGQVEMFSRQSTKLSDVRQEQKHTIRERCEKAAELAAHPDPSVIWCNFNAESALLGEIVPDSHQIVGSMNIDKKEELLTAFQSGEIINLITKPKITCFGLNWQHCNHTVFFPTFSYEQYYQAIRRFWRFGQTRPVTVDLVCSEGQEKVILSLMEKARKASDMFDNLNAALNKTTISNEKHFNQSVQLPGF